MPLPASFLLYACARACARHAHALVLVHAHAHVHMHIRGCAPPYDGVLKLSWLLQSLKVEACTTRPLFQFVTPLRYKQPPETAELPLTSTEVSVTAALKRWKVPPFWFLGATCPVVSTAELLRKMLPVTVSVDICASIAPPSAAAQLETRQSVMVALEANT